MKITYTPGLVSVVVASYNHARFLVQRMESLINQTYKNLEILVIDDCSPDNSVEILRRYSKHPLVRLLVREQNGGWVKVSNQGIELSRGEFIIFANCDDDCDPRMIERLIGATRIYPDAALSFCRSNMIDEQDRVMGDDYGVRERSFRRRCSEDSLLSRNEMRRFLMHSCVIPNLSAALIRRACLDRAGPLSADYRACSDWDLFFRLADHGDFAYVAEPLNRFRQHQQTIRSAMKGRVTYEEFFRVLLGQVNKEEFSLVERLRFRHRVMYLWAVELLRPSFAGLKNFPHHLKSVIALDPLSILFLLPALAGRILEVPFKLAVRLNKGK